ncbi:hypothetical protein BOTBODRAFT_35128, partial [Botryobasidium botryosum FD-172 SS1]
MSSVYIPYPSAPLLFCFLLSRYTMHLAVVPQFSLESGMLASAFLAHSMPIVDFVLRLTPGCMSHKEQGNRGHGRLPGRAIIPRWLLANL